MEPGVATNRALQLRAMDALRKRLVETGDQLASALPSVDRLAAADASELREMGAGRLGAVAMVVEDASMLDTAIPLVQSNVRRTDLLVTLADDTLIVLAPGLDPLGGQSLTARLDGLLVERLPSPAVVGVAYRSPLSLTGWDISQLADEARRRALSAPEPVENVV